MYKLTKFEDGFTGADHMRMRTTSDDPSRHANHNGYQNLKDSACANIGHNGKSEERENIFVKHYATGEVLPSVLSPTGHASFRTRVRTVPKYNSTQMAGCLHGWGDVNARHRGAFVQRRQLEEKWARERAASAHVDNRYPDLYMDNVNHQRSINKERKSVNKRLSHILGHDEAKRVARRNTYTEEQNALNTANYPVSPERPARGWNYEMNASTESQDNMLQGPYWVRKTAGVTPDYTLVGRHAKGKDQMNIVYKPRKRQADEHHDRYKFNLYGTELNTLDVRRPFYHAEKKQPDPDFVEKEVKRQNEKEARRKRRSMSAQASSHDVLTKCKQLKRYNAGENNDFVYPEDVEKCQKHASDVESNLSEVSNPLKDLPTTDPQSYVAPEVLARNGRSTKDDHKSRQIGSKDFTGPDVLMRGDTASSYKRQFCRGFGRQDYLKKFFKSEKSESPTEPAGMGTDDTSIRKKIRERLDAGLQDGLARFGNKMYVVDPDAVSQKSDVVSNQSRDPNRRATLERWQKKDAAGDVDRFYREVRFKDALSDVGSSVRSQSEHSGSSYSSSTDSYATSYLAAYRGGMLDEDVAEKYPAGIDGALFGGKSGKKRLPGNDYFSPAGVSPARRHELTQEHADIGNPRLAKGKKRSASESDRGESDKSSKKSAGSSRRSLSRRKPTESEAERLARRDRRFSQLGERNHYNLFTGTKLDSEGMRLLFGRQEHNPTVQRNSREYGLDAEVDSKGLFMKQPLGRSLQNPNGRRFAPDLSVTRPVEIVKTPKLLYDKELDINQSLVDDPRMESGRRAKITGEELDKIADGTSTIVHPKPRYLDSTGIVNQRKTEISRDARAADINSGDRAIEMLKGQDPGWKGLKHESSGMIVKAKPETRIPDFPSQIPGASKDFTRAHKWSGAGIDDDGWADDSQRKFIPKNAMEKIHTRATPKMVIERAGKDAHVDDDTCGSAQVVEIGNAAIGFALKDTHILRTPATRKVRIEPTTSQGHASNPDHSPSETPARDRLFFDIVGDTEPGKLDIIANQQSSRQDQLYPKRKDPKAQIEVMHVGRFLTQRELQEKFDQTPVAGKKFHDRVGAEMVLYDDSGDAQNSFASHLTEVNDVQRRSPTIQRFNTQATLDAPVPAPGVAAPVQSGRAPLKNTSQNTDRTNKADYSNANDRPAREDRRAIQQVNAVDISFKIPPPPHPRNQDFGNANEGPASEKARTADFAPEADKRVSFTERVLPPNQLFYSERDADLDDLSSPAPRPCGDADVVGVPCPRSGPDSVPVPSPGPRSAVQSNDLDAPPALHNDADPRKDADEDIPFTSSVHLQKNAKNKFHDDINFNDMQPGSPLFQFQRRKAQHVMNFVGGKIKASSRATIHPLVGKPDQRDLEEAAEHQLGAAKVAELRENANEAERRFLGSITPVAYDLGSTDVFKGMISCDESGHIVPGGRGCLKTTCQFEPPRRKNAALPRSMRRSVSFAPRDEETHQNLAQMARLPVTVRTRKMSDDKVANECKAITQGGYMAEVDIARNALLGVTKRKLQTNSRRVEPLTPARVRSERMAKLDVHNVTAARSNMLPRARLQQMGLRGEPHGRELHQNTPHTHKYQPDREAIIS